MATPSAMRMTLSELCAIEPMEQRIRTCGRALLISNSTLDATLKDSGPDQIAYLDRLFLLEIENRQNSKVARLVKRALPRDQDLRGL